MKSLVVKRSVVVAGHKTSVSLEDAFWKSLKEIAVCGDMSVSALLAAIDSQRRHAIYHRQFGCLCSASTASNSSTGLMFAISPRPFRR
jgi:predicted DNA-binding ribbon-helix-helix protein